MPTGSKYKNGTTSQAIKAEPGTVYAIVANSHTGGTVRMNDGASGTTSAGVKASGTLTSSGVFVDGEFVTIGQRTYAIKATLTGEPYEVLIGGSAAETLDNLKSAINASAGAGTTYGTGTLANDRVTATTNTDTAQTVEAYRIGTYGNAIVTTDTCANVGWGAGVLGGGAESSLLMNNTYSFPAGSGVLTFNNGISFNAGLFLTVGGTIDYTVIYS